MPTSEDTGSALLRVRIRHVAPVTPGLRSWLRGELTRAELDPPGLAPSAVLVVRRLSGGLPRSVAEPSTMRAPTQGWERGLRHELGSLLSRAVRPVRGRLPADAPAVVFADRAELTACLVADLLRGVAARWWWWEGPLRDFAGADVAGLLEHRVELLPGVFDLLASWDLAVAATQRIAPVRAVRMLTMLGHAFGLAPATAPADRPDRSGAAPPPRPLSRGRPGGPSLARAPWERWLGASAVGRHLAPEPALLLATALLLHRLPGAARSPELAMALARPDRSWWPAAPAAEPAGPQPRTAGAATPAVAEVPAAGPAVAVPPAAEPAGPQPRTAGAATPAVAEAPAAGPAMAVPPAAVAPPPMSGRTRDGSAGAPAGHPARTAAHAPPAGPGAAAAARDRTPVPEFTADQPTVHTTAEWGLPAGDGVRPSVVDSAVPGEPAAPADEEPAAAPRGPDALYTELAGVFYLLNLVRRLGLADAADPRWKVPGLSGWALLDALARGLLDGPDARDLLGDPLWRLLAHFDGRPAGALVGFDVDELPVEPDPATPPGTGGLLCGIAPGTRRWLRSVLPQARRRLADDLGVEPADAARVLRLPAWVYHSRTHLDVVVDLDLISLPVRLAGLDQDPGWVPALGRVVAFTFTPGGTG